MKEKDLNFEDTLWKAADKLRKKIEVHEYKYVVLGLIFLRYVSLVATIEEVAKNGYVLTPGRYIGIKLDEEDIPFEEKMTEYSKEMAELLNKEAELTERIKEVLKVWDGK